MDTDQKLRAAPIGTRAPAIMGGAWCKTERGWKWNGPDGNGGTFPRPGGDWTGKLILPGEATTRRDDWHYDSQGYCDNPGRGY